MAPESARVTTFYLWPASRAKKANSASHAKRALHGRQFLEASQNSIRRGDFIRVMPLAGEKGGVILMLLHDRNFCLMSLIIRRGR